ncbi:MAG: CBS domain-containing protein [Candidatus Micrarchaeota archaeon]|nr:CBS domain-containing protein [Candidatus Micrarchaeota archaeon]MDE1848345.1 CBS domain-containing protein [Candidatus Micrarchaeota archaeon]MDE1863916.1 CBS domain-containing protein [Candidatus Micrarchaeota archaeon]
MPKAFETIPQEFISEAKICDYKTPLSKVMGKISSAGSVVVLKGKDYYGIVDSRAIAARGMLKISPKLVVGKIAKKVPLLDEDTSIEQAIKHFHDSQTKVLPYTESSRVKGVIKREIILRAVLSLHLLSNYSVGDATSSPVIAIDRGASVAQAKSSMEKYKVNKIIVMDKARPYGILSYRDIIKGFARLDTRSSAIEKGGFPMDKQNAANVGAVCSNPVYSIDAKRPIEEAIKSLSELGISSLLVTRSERPAGVISVRDIFELAVSKTKGIEERIFISGLNSKTKEYEEEIKAELEKLCDKVNRFGKIKTQYISLHIKNSSSRNYEMKARIALAKGGTISSASFGYTLESALRELTENLYKEVRVKKEITMAGRKDDREAYEEQ